MASKVICDGVLTRLMTFAVSAPDARTRRLASASRSASSGLALAPPGTWGSAGVPPRSFAPGMETHLTQKWKVLPMPSPGDSAHIRPPIASQSRCEIASPRPVPSYFLVGERSTCWKDLKMESMLDELRPMPVSLT